MAKLIGVNERGLRVGEYHQHAKLSNEDCESIRDLNDQGWSYKRLSERFKVSKSCIAGICQHRRRCCFPTAWKRA